MHSLAFHEPGHFHAALTLRMPNPRVDPRVHLYASPGPERHAFLALVESFNTRTRSPTAWQVAVHDAASPQAALERLLDDRAADAVVVAGRNDRKMSTIARLTGAGLHVLADKPWTIDTSDLSDLAAATDGSGAIAMDIMTGRHDVIAGIRRRLVAERELFGRFREERNVPAIELGLVHHLLKNVNGAPLRRPAWYFDVRVQGDGLVDVQSHMTDQAQWLVEEAVESTRPFGYADDVVLEAARGWETPVPLDLYCESTGLNEFDTPLRPLVSDGVLALRCNGEIRYRLRGVSVLSRAEWRQREPAGAGDMHHTVVRGERSEIVVRQGPETGYRAELHVVPREGVSLRPSLTDAVASWREFPGLEVRTSDLGYELEVPEALRSGHEAHFAMVLEEFLDHLDRGHGPAESGPRLRTRYTLLARAHALASSGDRSQGR